MTSKEYCINNYPNNKRVIDAIERGLDDYHFQMIEYDIYENKVAIWSMVITLGMCGLLIGLYFLTK